MTKRDGGHKITVFREANVLAFETLTLVLMNFFGKAIKNRKNYRTINPVAARHSRSLSSFYKLMPL